MLRDTEYFRLWYERVKLKPSTRKNYATYLTHFESFLLESGMSEGDKLDFGRFYTDDAGQSWPIDTDFIREYVIWLSENLKQHPTAATNAYEALKSFFRTLHGVDMISKDPTVGVDGPKYHVSRKNQRLSVDEARAMIRIAAKKDPFWKRSLVLVYLFLLCGLRGGEVRALTLDQIDFATGLIRVDKGQRTGPGVVSMPKVVAEVLKHYVGHPEFARVIGASDTPILRNRYGTPLEYHQLVKEVRELAEAAGINRRIAPHVLRHTYASLAKEAGLSLEQIQEQLRHEDPSTTLLYVNPSKDAERDILNSSPMAVMLQRLSETRYKPRLM